MFTQATSLFPEWAARVVILKAYVIKIDPFFTSFVFVCVHGDELLKLFGGQRIKSSLNQQFFIWHFRIS